MKSAQKKFLAKEVKTIEEKLDVAFSSGRVGYKETYCDLDVIVAFGMAVAGLPEGSVSVRLLGGNSISRNLASALLRYWLTGDCEADAQYAAKRIDMGLNATRRSVSSAARAAEVLAYWKADDCVGCGGLKWLPIPGTPTLSDVPCSVCAGTGKKTRPWLGKQYADRSDMLLGKLDEVVREVARAAAQRLR